MGKVEPGGGLLDPLFTPVQQRVVGLLFGQPERRFQTSELIRLAAAGTGATHRLLKRLAESGLVRVTREGRQRYYQANDDAPVFAELVGLMQKTAGLAQPLRRALEPLADRIVAAFVYGSVASGDDRADSDIDLLVIGNDLDYTVLFDAIQAVEQQLGRAVNPNLLTPAEWRDRRRRDGFVARVVERPRLFILGSEDELG